jgi:hypothetical protein
VEANNFFTESKVILMFAVSVETYKEEKKENDSVESCFLRKRGGDHSSFVLWRSLLRLLSCWKLEMVFHQPGDLCSIVHLLHEVRTMKNPTFDLDVPARTRARMDKTITERMECVEGAWFPKPGRSTYDRVCSCGRMKKKSSGPDFWEFGYVCEVCDE